MTGRVMAVSLATAATGAVANGVYERFFEADLYNAGPVLARALFAFVWTVPFVLAGLVLFGLPIAFALRRLRLENGITLPLAGAAGGALFGYLLFQDFPRLRILVVLYGVVCAGFWWWLRPPTPKSRGEG